ncbi:MAG TPA: response regulator [Pyrinomonadaceae bacterium]|nr:response regulator [Pyrinomonadaceae bacterium]
MNFTKELLHKIVDPNRSPNERAIFRCELAKQYEESGNYEAARDAMGELWRGIGEPPSVEGLDQHVTGRVWLRIGVIIGWLSTTNQIGSSQEIAKNYITQSIAIFESQGDVKEVAEAQAEIAVCYGREGALDNARVMLSEALSKLNDHDGDLKGLTLLRSAIVEKLANRLTNALNMMTKAAPLFDASTNHALRGRFHNELATVLKNLGAAESRSEYIDRALIEYAAAGYHFEQAHHDRYQAYVENNLAMLFFRANRFAEAHERLDRAQALFTTLRDDVQLAQVAETRALVLLAQGDLVQAERFTRTAVHLLENGDERSLLAEALTTHGTALARLHREDQARAILERAIDIAEQAGDLERAGLGALTLVEELPEFLSDDELYSHLQYADVLLKNTQNVALLRRQKNCFRSFVPRILWPDWPTSLRNSMLKHEARQIRRALEDSGGVIKQAARSLELTHQGLQRILNTRQKQLRPVLETIKARASEMAAERETEKSVGNNDATRVRRAKRILHVEDNEFVAGIAREMLEAQGWLVETCADGNAALEKISGDAKYDLFLVDYDLPGVNGLELVSHARKLIHRSHTPIVVLSGTPVEADASEAGADAFLRKPQDIGSIVKTITRLISEQER